MLENTTSVPIQSEPKVPKRIQFEKQLTQAQLLRLFAQCVDGLNEEVLRNSKNCEYCETTVVACLVKKNKTRTSKVGAISKAQKAQKKIFGKKHEFLKKKISFKKSRIVPKNVKGGTLCDVLTYIQLQNMKKLEGGTLLEQ